MKILCYPTSLNHGYIVDAFSILRKKNNNLKFGFIYDHETCLSSLQYKNINYCEKNLSAIIYNLKKNKSSGKIDKNHLESFEKISKKNIWKIISADRVLGRSYITDLDIGQYKSDYIEKKKFLIVNQFIHISKSIKKIFESFKPDVVYISNGLSNIQASIIDVYAKFYETKVIVPFPTLFKNYFFFSDSIYPRNNKIKNLYYKTLKKNITCKKINLFFNEILSKGIVPSYDRENTRSIIINFKKKFFIRNNFFIIFFTISKHLILKTLFILKIKIKHLKIMKNYKLIDNIIHEISLRNKFIETEKVDFPNLNCNYVYFPLFSIPETTSLLLGNDFMNAFFIIELMSKNIPSNYKLLVKEHPAMFSSHSRNSIFYKRVKQLPNVELVPISFDGVKLIKHSKLVVVIDGSSGFEAILSGKPMLTLNRDYYTYSFFDQVFKCTNFDNLYNDVNRAINSATKTKKNIFKKKIKALLYSIHKTSYILTKPGIFFFGEKKFNETEQKICGKDLANALISELKI